VQEIDMPKALQMWICGETVWIMDRLIDKRSAIRYPM